MIPLLLTFLNSAMLEESHATEQRVQSTPYAASDYAEF
jgi:hypothetical protein